MRRSSALLTSVTRSRGAHDSWCHALLASAWGMPEALATAARRYRSIVPVVLHANDTTNNDNNKSSVAEKLRGQPVSLGAETHTAFMRRGRAAGNARETPRGTAEDGDIQTGVTGATLASNNRALDAFQCWSRRTGGCTANEFFQGVQQSYYSLGVVLGTLAEAAKASMPLGKTAPLAAALGQLKVLLTKNYGVSPVSLANEPDAADAKSCNGERRNTAKAVGQALMQVLPISPNLADHIYHIWDKQRTLEANLFCIAGPTDYILLTEMILFHECNNKEEVHFAGDTPLTLTKVPPSPGVGHNATAAVATSRDGQVKSSGESKPACDVEEAKAEDVVVVACSAAASADGAANSKEARQPTGQIIITYKGHPLPPIPANALACVVATIDVVTPPQRYAPTFDWFYQRITGHESEYERIAAARIFAMSNARPLVAPLDFIMRMFTGRHMEFMCANGVSELIGIPKNIRECPPATRKLLCFYMDSDQQWVLADLVTVDSVLTTMVPKAAPA